MCLLDFEIIDENITITRISAATEAFERTTERTTLAFLLETFCDF